MTYDVAVIGGGPAGLMAAGIAARRGLRVLLLERMNRTGRKLRITGKGRCNITNITPLPEFIQHFGKNGKFLRQAFSQFFSQDLIDFFNKIGVETTVERGNRVFPTSGSAVEVTDALIKWAVKCGVEIRNESRVFGFVLDEGHITGITYHIEKYNDKQQLKIKGHEARKIESTTVAVNSVILATGGQSYPLTGSTGDGFILAESIGHSIIDTLPALVPLLTDEHIMKQLNGLALKNVKASLFIDNKKVLSDFGEMEFRDNTVCGPIILSMSGKAVKEVQSAKFDVRSTNEKTPLPPFPRGDLSDQYPRGNEKYPPLPEGGSRGGVPFKGELVLPNMNSLFSSGVVISIDLKPALEMEQLDARLLREIEKGSRQPFQVVLNGLLPQQMIPLCAELTKLDLNKPSNQVTGEERKRLRLWLKDFKLPIMGYRDWNEAIITAGGVDLKTVDPRSMASKIVPNLYFAGEILDLDADTGGYNLQAAFSTGWVAGNSVTPSQ